MTHKIVLLVAFGDKVEKAMLFIADPKERRNQ
jgi:hypothetical protein